MVIEYLENVQDPLIREIFPFLLYFRSIFIFCQPALLRIISILFY